MILYNAQLMSYGWFDKMDPEKFAECWNAMCEFNDKAVINFRYLQVLQEAGYKIMLVSSTNEMHHHYIQEQLQKHNIVLNPEQTYLALSYQQNTLNWTNLTGNIIEQHHLDMYDNNITSFCREGQIPVDIANLYYMNYDFDKELLCDVLPISNVTDSIDYDCVEGNISYGAYLSHNMLYNL